MIKQYPHYLFVKQVTPATQDPETGNWLPGSESWELHSFCREEPNGKGSVVRGPDGQQAVFSSNVFMPKDTDMIDEGVEARVCNTLDEEASIRVSGQVLRFHPGQLNCKLWL